MKREAQAATGPDRHIFTGGVYAYPDIKYPYGIFGVGVWAEVVAAGDLMSGVSGQLELPIGGQEDFDQCLSYGHVRCPLAARTIGVD